MLLSLGTFNYFLASTHDFNFQNSLVNEDSRKISSQIIDLGDLWMLSGNVSLLSDIPSGELKVMIFPYGSCNLEIDPQCIVRNQALTEIIVDDEGSFSISHLEEGRYSLYTVVELKNEDIILVEAVALGGVSLEDFTVDGEIDLQIAISYTSSKEIVYK
jgi:hypothetical protein